ncbi:hypothetical protein [Pseudomonas fluorescens]|uniref:hypothetical protein n=1 Tax=Pseudomonas fluorescens TaxID=294 RepID=UPI00123F86E1|nr:hypothetical protein [Pseudomonas fluorescens]VVN25575.1 hypothetical protein PS676_04542 [Pseudomonas fluorescens]
MRGDLVGLQWLSVDQALLWLKDEVSVLLSDKDLLAQCDEGRCAVYLNVDNLKGVCFEGLRDEHDERFHTVYGVGKGQIVNPRVFIEAAATVDVELEISGEVRQLQLVETDSYPNTEWVASLPRERCHPLFKPTDLKALAEVISVAVETSAPAPAPAPPKPSHLLAISALMELLEEKGGPSYNSQKIVGLIDERYGPDSPLPLRGLGDSNLEKMFADASTKMKEAKKKSLARLQMQNRKLQLK